MHNEESSVDRLNETLNSRTNYVPPSDTRSPVHASAPNDAPEKWDSPDLDAMIERHVDEEKPSKIKAFFIASIVVFAAALGIASYVYFGGGNFISTKNVDISVTGPAVIGAGEPLSLVVTVENGNNAAIEGANLTIQYPEGTRQPDDHTASLVRDKTAIGEIKSGGESTHTFRSALFGQKGAVFTVKLSLEYKIANSSATFYKEKTFDVTIGDTPVVIGIERPSSLTSGEPFATRIVVASNSSDVIKNLVVRAEYPYGYSLISSDPQAASGNNFWSLGDLAPGDKKTIAIRGSITGVDDEERTFRYYAGVADPGSPTTLKSALVSTTDTVHIARPDVALSISMNGESEGDYVAPAGSTVTATINYENNAPEKLNNTRITARITGVVLDKTSIRPSQGGFYDSNTGLVTWQAPGKSDLASLTPGAGDSVSVSFASQPNLQPGTSQAIELTASIAGVPGGLASQEPLTNTASKTVKISSTVNFTGKVLYSRGPYKNTGPLPPKAEATTTYSVVWDLGNTQNEVGNGKVTAKLGANVRFITGGAGADAVTYDEASNTLTWNVGTLESGTGFSKPLRETVFQVALKPSIGQIGTAPSLVSGISFSGVDTFTSLPVSASLQNMTTKLSSDSRFTQGDETVVK